MGVAGASGRLVMEDIEIDVADPVERCRRGREAPEVDRDSSLAERPALRGPMAAPGRLAKWNPPF